MRESIRRWAATCVRWQGHRFSELDAFRPRFGIINSLGVCCHFFWIKANLFKKRKEYQYISSPSQLDFFIMGTFRLRDLWCMSFHTFVVLAILGILWECWFTIFWELSAYLQTLHNFEFVLSWHASCISHFISQENTLEGLHQGHLNEQTCSCAFQNLLPLYFTSVSTLQGL